VASITAYALNTAVVLVTDFAGYMLRWRSGLRLQNGCSASLLRTQIAEEGMDRARLAPDAAHRREVGTAANS